MLLWRTDLVRPAPTGWSVLSDPRYAGRIGLYDAAITLADTAIRLGYRNPYELTKSQFRRVVRAAAEQSAAVGSYWQDLTDALADYTGGNAIVGEVTPRLAMLLRRDQVPVATAVPRGGTARSASWMLLAGARHPGCMYRWLDYIVSGKANAKSARYLDEAPATPAACAYMNCARRACGRRALVVTALVLADAAAGLPRRAGRRLRALAGLVGRLGPDPVGLSAASSNGTRRKAR